LKFDIPMTASLFIYQICPVCHENLGEEAIRNMQSSSFPAVPKVSIAFSFIFFEKKVSVAYLVMHVL